MEIFQYFSWYPLQAPRIEPDSLFSELACYVMTYTIQANMFTYFINTTDFWW